MTVEQLDKISAQRLEDVDIDTLVEVNSIKYADGMPVEKKVAGMIAKTGNPYFRRSGKSKIKISFSDNGESLKDNYIAMLATVYKGNIIKNLIMDCQSYTKYRPNETTGGIFVSWRRKEELPTGA